MNDHGDLILHKSELNESKRVKLEQACGCVVRVIVSRKPTTDWAVSLRLQSEIEYCSSHTFARSKKQLLEDYDKIRYERDRIMIELQEHVRIKDLEEYNIGWRYCENKSNPLRRCLYYYEDGPDAVCYFCGLPEVRKKG